jgi:hypothetical protein
VADRVKDKSCSLDSTHPEAVRSVSPLATTIAGELDYDGAISNNFNTKEID